MPSSPLGSTHDRTTSGVACHHRLLEAQTVEPRRAWHANITFGQHTRSNYVGRGMPLSPLGSTNGRTTSGVACQHHVWAAHTVKRRRAWHASIAFGQHTRSKDVERGMTSPPLDSAHGRTTSGATCHHRLWKAHRVERRRAWHANITFGQHTRSNDVGRGIPASPLDSTWSKDVVRGITSPPFDSAHGRTTSSTICHHHLWKAHTVERRRAWHAIITVGQHTRSNDVGHGMPASP